MSFPASTVLPELIIIIGFKYIASFTRKSDELLIDFHELCNCLVILMDLNEENTKNCITKINIIALPGPQKHTDCYYLWSTYNAVQIQPNNGVITILPSSL